MYSPNEDGKKKNNINEIKKENNITGASENTTIQITKITREKLKTLKITKLDTYEEIINRMIDTHYKDKSNVKND